MGLPTSDLDSQIRSIERSRIASRITHKKFGSIPSSKLSSSRKGNGRTPNRSNISHNKTGNSNSSLSTTNGYDNSATNRRKGGSNLANNDKYGTHGGGGVSSNTSNSEGESSEGAVCVPVKDENGRVVAWNTLDDDGNVISTDEVDNPYKLGEGDSDTKFENTDKFKPAMNLDMGSNSNSSPVEEPGMCTEDNSYLYESEPDQCTESFSDYENSSKEEVSNGDSTGSSSVERNDENE
jgi:hypothetical protein